MRFRTGLVMLALLAPAGGARALPPLAAGALASDNVDYVATIPDVASIGGKILDGLLYTTTVQGLRIYDVTQGIPLPVGALELPHFQNESVDTDGELLLIAADHFAGPVDVVYVIDVSEPRAPLLKSVVRASSAHTVSCIRTCRYAWTQGGDVLDLTDPAAPVVGYAPWLSGHDANVDAAGFTWVGTRVYDTRSYGETGSLLSPPVYASGPFGWHNSLRPHAELATPELLANNVIDPGELVIGTDEIWTAATNGLCSDDGPFKTSWLRIQDGVPTIQPLDRFQIGRGTQEGSKPVGVVACSSHWFDHHDGVVADAWYEQGVRFLDVSDPRDIRQVGYYMPATTEAWMALFHDVSDGPLPGTYVYVFDAVRGLDVLRWSGDTADATALAPHLNQPRPGVTVEPSPEWGFSCRIVATPADPLEA